MILLHKKSKVKYKYEYKSILQYLFIINRLKSKYIKVIEYKKILKVLDNTNIIAYQLNFALYNPN